MIYTASRLVQSSTDVTTEVEDVTISISPATISRGNQTTEIKALQHSH